MSAFWTPERIDTLKRMAADKCSASVIAREIGATRNQVIGKAGRLKVGLSQKRAIVSQAMRGALASSAKAAAKRAKPSLPQVLSAPNSPVSDAGAGNKAEDLRETVAMLGAAPEEIGEVASSLDQHPSGDMTGQSSAGVTLFDLRRDSCRFPVSGEGIGTIFCGEKAEEGRSYCPVCYPRTITKSAGGDFTFNRKNDEREAA